MRQKGGDGREYDFDYTSGQWIPVQAQAAQVASAGASDGERPALLTGENWLTRNAQAAAVSGIGLGVTMARNLRDVGAMVTGDDAQRMRIEAARQEHAQRMGALRQEAPVGAFVGQAVPTALMAAAAGPMLVPQALMAAGLGAATSESGDYGLDAAVGGAFSLGGSLASRMVSRGMAARETSRMARMAQLDEARLRGEGLAGEGVQGAVDRLRTSAPEFARNLTPAQQAMNVSARQIEEGFGATPWMNGPLVAQERRAAELYAQEIGKGLGVPNAGGLRQISQEVIGETYDRIGQRFTRVEQAIDPKRLSAAVKGEGGLIEQFNRTAAAEQLSLTGGNFLRFAQRAEEIAAKQDLTGAQIMNWRSQLVDKLRDMGKPGAAPDSALRDSLWKSVDQIDDVIGRSIRPAGGDDAGELYKTARQQWKLLQSVERALTPDGRVSGLMMHNALTRSDPVGYARAGLQNPVYDMTRFMASSMGRPIVNTGSQTAMRQAAQEMISNPTMIGLATRAAQMAGGAGAMQAYRRLGTGNVQAWTQYINALGQSASSEGARRAGGIAGAALAGGQ